MRAVTPLSASDCSAARRLCTSSKVQASMMSPGRASSISRVSVRTKVFSKRTVMEGLPCAAGGVEAVAQPVAQKIEAENGQENGEARKDADPPGGLQIGAAIGQHAAPAGNGRIDAHAEEGQAAFQEDVGCDVQRHQND